MARITLDEKLFVQVGHVLLVQGFTGFFPSLVEVTFEVVAVVVAAGVVRVLGFVPGVKSLLRVEADGDVGLLVTVVEVDEVVGLVVAVVEVETSYLSSYSKLTGLTLKIKRTFPSTEVVKSALALLTL